MGFTKKLITVNIEAVVAMTKIVLPGMAARRKGAVVNLSSMSALALSPFFAVYGGSKSFVDYFSRALSLEYSEFGITVQSVSPFYVRTPMTEPQSKILSRFLFFYPTAETFAASAVRTLPFAEQTTGYWLHGWIFFWCTSISGMWVNVRLWHYLGRKLIKRRGFDETGGLV